MTTDLNYLNRKLLNVFPNTPTEILPSRIAFAMPYLKAIKDEVIEAHEGTPNSSALILALNTAIKALEHLSSEYEVSLHD